MMASAPGHPIWDKVIEELGNRDPKGYPVGATGKLST